VAREKDDWRLTGQASYLQGAALTWKRYRAWSETWEHDHCAFCWAKFMDPDFSEAHRRFIEEHPEVLTEGYATTAEHEGGADGHWVCRPCFDDFADLFEWRVVRAG
jgi:hypothetical protein